MKIVVAALGSLAMLGGAASAEAAAGDATHGRAVFARCIACHDTATGANRIGPSLKGVVGRKAASAAGFNYSAALKGKNVAWTSAALDSFLTAPSRYAPGTRMVIAVPDPKDRADLVAYLTTLR